MFFIHNNACFLQLDYFDAAAALQDKADAVDALITAIRVMSSGPCADQYSAEIAAIATLLYEFNLTKGQANAIEIKHGRDLQSLLSHPDSSVFTPSK